jgi:hypothetical protein
MRSIARIARVGASNNHPGLHLRDSTLLLYRNQAAAVMSVGRDLAHREGIERAGRLRARLRELRAGCYC